MPIIKNPSKAKKAFKENVLTPFRREIVPKYLTSEGKFEDDAFIDKVIELLANYSLSKAAGITKGTLKANDFTKEGLEGIITLVLGMDANKIVGEMIANPDVAEGLVADMGKKYGSYVAGKNVESYIKSDAYKGMK